MLRRHKGGPLEITLGKYEPQFVIYVAEGCYALLPLVLDRARAEEAAQQWLAEGHCQPEMYWRFLAPGKPIRQEGDLRVFMQKLEAWRGWGKLEDRA